MRILFAMLVNLLITEVVTGRQQIVTITASRPLADVADRLEQELKVSISYEDPVWSWDGDQALASELPANREAARKNPAWKGPVVPSGGAVQLSVASIERAKASGDVLSLLNEVLNNHASNGNPGDFRVIRYRDRQYSIVPDQVRDSSGNKTPAVSPFDTPISFPVGDRSRLETIQLICSALNQTGHYRMSNGPVGDSRALATQQIQLGAVNEIARDVLAKALDGIGKYSWRLYSGPPTNAYVLNLHYVP